MMHFRLELYIYISLLFTLLLSACSIETYLLIDTITFSPQPIKVQAGKQAEVSIDFLVRRSNGDCRITDSGEIELELLDQDKKSPITWLVSYQILPNPVPFNGEIRKKKSCYAESNLSFRIQEEAPLGLQRVKLVLVVNAPDKQGQQYVDFLIEVVP